MKLSELKTGEFGIITKVTGIGAFRKRIMEMGFIRGKKVIVVKEAPLKDPVEYNVMGYEVTLRHAEADLIEVVTEDEVKNIELNGVQGNFNGVFTEEKFRKTAQVLSKTINVAMVGNPNAGKTSIFNIASNSREHVGNYAGVTVDSKTASIKYKGFTINITDLPGTYSLTAYTPEEIYVRQFIANSHPDVIINVVDASNLERNLYLTTQLIDMDIKLVVALNMFDELESRSQYFDYHSLAKMIGVPMVPTVGSKGTGINELFDKIINIYSDKEKIRRHVHIHYGQDVENSILKLRNCIRDVVNKEITLHFSSRFLALKLLENDQDVHQVLSICSNYSTIRDLAVRERKYLENSYGEDCETIITNAKYGFIAGALLETYSGEFQSDNQKSVRIDKLLTHKYWGYPIFFFILWIMFEATFSFGKYPVGWIDEGVSLLSNFLRLHFPDGSFKDLLIDGIIGGTGGVLVFLPNILFLFFFISLMEDTGYMARAAFIMDRIMHRIGLHGKSFIPLIMGFGCNVPAVMATRTIENHNSRIITMLINPFFSCSARLPVYVLIISVMAPHNPGLILFAMYIIGILIACLVAIILKRYFFKKHEIPFVMELPPYRIPNPRTTIKHMWFKGEQYLRKMGGVILTASIIIWALGYFPRNIKYSKDYDKSVSQVISIYNSQLSKVKDKNQLKKVEDEKQSNLDKIYFDKAVEHQSKTYVGIVGRFINRS